MEAQARRVAKLTKAAFPDATPKQLWDSVYSELRLDGVDEALARKLANEIAGARR